MPGIVLGETSSCTNPLLPFFYQEDGFLKDIYALRWEVLAANSATVLTSGTVNTSSCVDGGTRVGLGYYTAVLDPSGASLTAGPHTIVWYYQVTAYNNRCPAGAAEGPF